MKKTLLLLGLASGLVLSLPASAKLYKWVDNQGITHYGETIPPEYANQSRVELKQGWRQTNSKEVLTGEQLRQQQEKQQQQQANKENAQEQKRRDSALLNTYTTEQEIDLARDRNMEQVDARLKSVAAQLRIYTDKLSGLEKEQQRFSAAGKKIPPSLTEDLDETRNRVEKMQKEQAKIQQDKQTLSDRFNNDKQRFRELKGIK